jgi:hypothetical protein
VTLVGAMSDSPIDLVADHSSHRERAIARLRRDPEVRLVRPNTVESDDYIDRSRSQPAWFRMILEYLRLQYPDNVAGMVQPPWSYAGVAGA